MSPFWNRRIKTKETAFLIERIAYLFLFLFSISIFYLLWKAYTELNYTYVLIYTVFYLVYLTGTFLIIRDIYNNYDFFKKTGNIEGAELIEKAHFFCANPMCERCGGWYWGLATTLASTLTLRDSIVSILQKFGITAYYSILFGSIIFLITTPFHGTLNFMTKIKWYNKIYSSSRTKMILGLISGFSIAFIVIGILML